MAFNKVAVAVVVAMVVAVVVARADKAPQGPRLHHFTGQDGYDSFGQTVAHPPVYKGPSHDIGVVGASGYGGSGSGGYGSSGSSGARGYGSSGGGVGSSGYGNSGGGGGYGGSGSGGSGGSGSGGYGGSGGSGYPHPDSLSYHTTGYKTQYVPVLRPVGGQQQQGKGKGGKGGKGGPLKTFNKMMEDAGKKLTKFVSDYMDYNVDDSNHETGTSYSAPVAPYPPSSHSYAPAKPSYEQKGHYFTYEYDDYEEEDKEDFGTKLAKGWKDAKEQVWKWEEEATKKLSDFFTYDSDSKGDKGNKGNKGKGGDDGPDYYYYEVPAPYDKGQYASGSSEHQGSVEKGKGLGGESGGEKGKAKGFRNGGGKGKSGGLSKGGSGRGKAKGGGGGGKGVGVGGKGVGGGGGGYIPPAPKPIAVHANPSYGPPPASYGPPPASYGPPPASYGPPPPSSSYGSPQHTQHGPGSSSYSVINHHSQGGGHIPVVPHNAGHQETSSYAS